MTRLLTAIDVIEDDDLTPIGARWKFDDGAYYEWMKNSGVLSFEDPLGASHKWDVPENAWFQDIHLIVQDKMGV